MNISHTIFEPSMIFLAWAALFAALLMSRAVSAPHVIERPQSEEAVELFGTTAMAWLLTGLFIDDMLSPLPMVSLFLAIAAAVRYYAHRLNMPGVLWVTVQPLALLLSTMWAAAFIAGSALPDWAQGVAFTGLAFGALRIGAGMIESFAREAVSTHELWRLPIAAPEPKPAAKEPRISVQLPCYAEPPEVVKCTIDRLAVQSYRNFEILVCDNNTPDEALWRPLETYCAKWNARLGEERFHFFHVAPLAGAKAGALNWLMDRMDQNADLIAVIDADYYAEPDFLARMSGFFSDPKIGYIQTPHDYRDHEGSVYLNACYWEYMPNNKVEMRGVSEYGGAFTIGTMCLLRTEALIKAGGWAEWCLTEDSEVSVRLRAVGYEGLYLGETFGRGLIPDSFDDYKKQRFRWTAGPVQQLRRHWRLFLPAPFAAPMPGWTKLLEILRCLAPLQMLFGFAATLLGLAAILAPIVMGHIDPIDMPNVIWLLTPLGLATGLARLWHRYRLSGCETVEEMAMGEIARQSLFCTILVAGIAGLSAKPLAWRRTPKFAPGQTRESPLDSSLPESIWGGALLLVTCLLLAERNLIGNELAMLSAISIALYAARFLCAPLMAMLSIAHVNGDDRDMRLSGHSNNAIAAPVLRPDNDARPQPVTAKVAQHR